jgi:hypothetical protein
MASTAVSIARITTARMDSTATKGTQVTESSPPDIDVSAVYLQQQTHKEIIAGSVIGSFMVLVVVVFAIGILVAWRKKVKEESRDKGNNGVELRGMESGEEVNEEERPTP